MAHTPTLRRRTARGLAVVTLAAAALGGALATPAAAAHSQGYSTLAACRDAQRAYGSSSFVRISKACYSYFPRIDGVGWDPTPYYRFDYVTRY